MLNVVSIPRLDILLPQRRKPSNITNISLLRKTLFLGRILEKNAQKNTKYTLSITNL